MSKNMGKKIGKRIGKIILRKDAKMRYNKEWERGERTGDMKEVRKKN